MHCAKGLTSKNSAYNKFSFLPLFIFGASILFLFKNIYKFYKNFFSTPYFGCLCQWSGMKIQKCKDINIKLGMNT